MLVKWHNYLYLIYHSCCIIPSQNGFNKRKCGDSNGIIFHTLSISVFKKEMKKEEWQEYTSALNTENGMVLQTVTLSCHS